MGKPNYYHYVAHPEVVFGPAEINEGLVTGLTCASGLEARMMRLLINAKIPFDFQIKYTLPKRDGSGFFVYIIDYVFKEPQKFGSVGKWVTHLEVKGVLTPHDLERLECLQHHKDVKGFIALPSIVEYWERFGLDGKYTGTEPKPPPKVAQPPTPPKPVWVKRRWRGNRRGK